MANVASPTVGSPMINFPGVSIPSVELPKVTCVADATRYPYKPGSEDVLLDVNDPEIAYFRKIDANGFVQVDRRRCVPEPEPTIEELNDRKYLSKDEFQSFREEMLEHVRVLTDTVTAAIANTSANKQTYKPAKQRDTATTADKVSDADAKSFEQPKRSF